MNQFSFQKGFSQVRVKDIHNIKKEIMESLGITTRAAWGARLKGKIEPKVSEARSIEEIFRKYGINNIWGE